MTVGRNDQRGTAPSKKTRYGAPDGPRKKSHGKTDGSEPLEYIGHETVAHFLAEPEALRECKSETDLAREFQVTRMTIYRWKHDTDVIQRAHWLSTRNKVLGDLVARREWPEIMEKAVERAKNGDVQAMKFCESRAWAEDQPVECTEISETLSFDELVGTNENEAADHLQAEKLPAKGEN